MLGSGTRADRLGLGPAHGEAVPSSARQTPAGQVWPSHCSVPRDNNPQTWHYRTLWRALGIAKCLHQARANMETLQMGAPGMQAGRWDRLPPAGIELWGLVALGTLRIQPCKEGSSPFLGPCASVVPGHGAQLQVPAGEALYMRNGGIKAQLPSIRSLQRGSYRGSRPGPGSLIPTEPEGSQTWCKKDILLSLSSLESRIQTPRRSRGSGQR